jgi:hypothetical protein
MQLYVLADQAGNILGAHILGTAPRARGRAASRSASMMVPALGQVVHAVELPEELHLHLLENTLEAHLFSYRVERQGNVSRLIK